MRNCRCINCGGVVARSPTEDEPADGDVVHEAYRCGGCQRIYWKPVNIKMRDLEDSWRRWQ